MAWNQTQEKAEQSQPLAGLWKAKTSTTKIKAKVEGRLKGEQARALVTTLAEMCKKHDGFVIEGIVWTERKEKAPDLQLYVRPAWNGNSEKPQTQRDEGVDFG